MARSSALAWLSPAVGVEDRGDVAVGRRGQHDVLDALAGQAVDRLGRRAGDQRRTAGVEGLVLGGQRGDLVLAER